MGAILDHVGQLQQVDTAGLDADASALDPTDVTRPDRVSPSLSVEDVLANAPDRAERLLRA